MLEATLAQANRWQAVNMNAIVLELVKVAELLETDTANSPLTRRDTIDIELRRSNLEDPATGRYELYDNE